jgi:hypothetical protein
LTFPKLSKTVEYLVHRWGPIKHPSKLKNIIFLADHRWSARKGSPYTEAVYRFWNQGPFSREILKVLDWLDGVEIVEEQVGETSWYRAGHFSRLKNIELDESFVALLNELGEKYCSLPAQVLIDEVYGLLEVRKASFGELLLGRS